MIQLRMLFQHLPYIIHNVSTPEKLKLQLPKAILFSIYIELVPFTKKVSGL